MSLSLFLRNTYLLWATVNCTIFHLLHVVKVGQYFNSFIILSSNFWLFNDWSLHRNNFANFDKRNVKQFD